MRQDVQKYITRICNAYGDDALHTFVWRHKSLHHEGFTDEENLYIAKKFEAELDWRQDCRNEGGL